MSIELSKPDRAQAIASIERYFQANLDEKIGNVSAGALLSFILEEIGPSLYNRGVNDAKGYMQTRVEDLEFEVHQDEFQYWQNLKKRR